MDNFNTLAICGPTASGKTSLAVKIALRYNCEIISCDSRQLYRGMDIGTGKDAGEYKTADGEVPCHLIDIADPSRCYSLYDYLTDFDTAFRSVLSRYRLPLLTGGSGLYMEAALKNYDLSDAPENPELRAELETLNKEKLLEILQDESPEISGRTDISSKRRIIRGIEIARHPGSVRRKKSSGRAAGPEILPLIIGIRPGREEIIRRIDSRLEKRLAEGMLDEVRSLIAGGIGEERLIRFGLEYRYCTLHLTGRITYQDMVDKLKTEIHRLAKRQMTWFRGMERRGLHINWITPDDLNSAAEIIEKYVNEDPRPDF